MTDDLAALLAAEVLALRAKLAEAEGAFTEVLRISDRDHVAWDHARAALAKIREGRE